MKLNQLEFGLESKPTICRSRHRGRRLPGARWWFDQMHQAVEGSPDWAVERLQRIKQADFAFTRGRN